MQIAKVAYLRGSEPASADASLQQVAAVLARVCDSLGASGCGWLSDFTALSSYRFGAGHAGLNASRVATDKVLLAYNADASALTLNASEMIAIAAYQRKAWTPSLQNWPVTAWAKAAPPGTPNATPQTTVCIPLHGPNGTNSMVFVPLGLRVTAWYETALMFVGPLLEAEQELRSVFFPEAGPANALSSQEVESLNWAAKGKTAWESAQIQGIPERTVVQRLKRVREKLGVGSTAEAIGAAIRLKIIDSR